MSDTTTAACQSSTNILETTSIDETFRQVFAITVQRWSNSSITKEDSEYLKQHTFTDRQFVQITEEFGLKHAVELINHRIVFMEYPTAVHEDMNRQMDRWVDRMYGDALDALGSTSICYTVGFSKQGDASYIPPNLPPPSSHNQLKYQPNTQSHYPTLVFECAVTHENRNRLLEDAEAKYFSPETSVQVWIGLKVRLSLVQNGESFWIGWGRRKTIGFGLKLEEQSEDEEGIAAFLPLYTPGNAPMADQLTIPSRLIFAPLQPPATVGPNFVIPYESVRLAIMRGLSYMS